MKISDGTLEELRGRLKDYVELITKPSPKAGKNFYVCPLCGSGQGENRTGAFHITDDGRLWRCYRCKSEGRPYEGDVFDLVGLVEDEKNFRRQAEILAEKLHIDLREEAAGSGAGKPTVERRAEPSEARKAEEEPDYTSYYNERRKWITDPAAAKYLAGRGISMRTAKAAGIGYDPEADPASNPGGAGVSEHPAGRLIIPAGKSFYVARRVDGVEEYAKVNSKGSRAAISFAEALTAGHDVAFVTEGCFDALSVMELGWYAVALNSAGYGDRLLEVLREKNVISKLILVPDNDRAGRDCMRRLLPEIEKLGIEVIVSEIGIVKYKDGTVKKYKDLNDYLVADRRGLERDLELAYSRAMRPDSMRVYALGGMLDRDICRYSESGHKTGFSSFDQLAGGFYPGLYVLGAISSLGKTTFCWQMADQMASSGQDVLFISMEQSRLDLLSYSVARRIAEKNPESQVSAADIRKSRYPKEKEKAVAEMAEDVGDRLSVVDGNRERVTVDLIRGKLESYVKSGLGVAPVIFIDYLQKIRMPERQQDVRIGIDRILEELRSLAVSYNIPIIAISSLNRSNYSIRIGLESFKESGNIEYDADGILGMQLAVINDPIFDDDKKAGEKRKKIELAKAENPRKIELSMLKYREVKAGTVIDFDYYAGQSRFVDSQNWHQEGEAVPFAEE